MRTAAIVGHDMMLLRATQPNRQESLRVSNLALMLQWLARH
jgi:hypothetical protein